MRTNLHVKKIQPNLIAIHCKCESLRSVLSRSIVTEKFKEKVKGVLDVINDEG